MSNGDGRESTRDFPTVADAEADAMLHGYVPGVSFVGTIAARPNGSLSSMLAGEKLRATLVVRHRTPERWTWELRTRDGRVLCFTDADFDTRDDCEADATRRVFGGPSEVSATSTQAG